VIRVDGRGTGKSPGTARRLSDKEARDFYYAIEWSAAQLFQRNREFNSSNRELAVRAPSGKCLLVG
jgi:hypothetical protein